MEEFAEKKKLMLRLVRNRRRNMILDALTVLFGSICIVCIIELAFYHVGSYRYQKSMRKLTDAIGGGIAEDSIRKMNEARVNHDMLLFPDETEHELIGYISRFDEDVSDAWREKFEYLFSQNNDCVGYIEVPDTKLSWPVMFVPEKYDKYLYRNFENKYELRGLPFMDAETKIGRSRNYLIYGHNMNDETNFGTLRKYLDKKYCDAHPYVYFNTVLSEGVYQVMFVCRSKIFAKSDTCFKYYNFGGVLSEAQFNTYLREMEKLALIDTGVTAEWGDELLSLSTCDHYTDDGRLIVVCKRIQ